MWSITPPSFEHALYLRAKNPSNQSDKAASTYKINVVQYKPNIRVGIIAKAAAIRKADKKLTKNFIFFSFLISLMLILYHFLVEMGINFFCGIIAKSWYFF